MFYRKIGGKIEIEFNEPQNEPTEQTNNLSKLNWMAPEIMQENTKPVS